MDLDGEHDIPEYFITRTLDVQEKLDDNFDKWLKGKSGRNPDNPIIGIVRGRDEDEDWLSRRKDWAVLEPKGIL